MSEPKDQNQVGKEATCNCKMCAVLGKCSCCTKTLIIVAVSVILSVLVNSFVSQGKADGKVMEQWVKDNPKVILDSVNDYFAEEQRKARVDMEAKSKTAIADNLKKLERNSNDPVVNKNGKVTLVEFFDYNCGYCHAANNSLKELISNNKTARIVHKHFPILSEESNTAARYALAVYYSEPAKYLKFHNAIFEAKDKTPAGLEAVAKGLGINIASLQKSLKNNGEKIDATLQENRQLAVEIGIQGTPAFIINSKLTPGMVDTATLEQMVKEAADK